METGTPANRALQLRAIDRLRQRLDGPLPSVDGLAESDADQLREIGGGRLGGVAIVAQDRSALDAVARLVQRNVRRTDLLLTHADDTLLVLAPGLDPVGGQSLTARLERLLAEHLPETPVALGATYRSALSLHGCHPAHLAAEARRRALTTTDDLAEQVA